MKKCQNKDDQLPELMSKAKELKMFLIQERGPTSFVFKLKQEVDPELPVEA